jgi:hypothetical protein
VQQLLIAKRDLKLSRLIQRYARYEGMIIDDLGYIRQTREEMEVVFTLLAERYERATDWVWDHSSRKKPLLPCIRMGDGALRYRPSGIEAFIDERERLSALRRRA